MGVTINIMNQGENHRPEELWEYNFRRNLDWMVISFRIMARSNLGYLRGMGIIRGGNMYTYASAMALRPGMSTSRRPSRRRGRETR